MNSSGQPNQRPVQPVEERFWARVDKSGDCWTWKGVPAKNGYAPFSIRGKKHYAHRLSYEWACGPIPDGREIDHMCHNRFCVKPAHLRVVTHKQNNENREGAQSNSKSGIRGVFWCKRTQRWRTAVRHNRQTYETGYYADIEDAKAAVLAKRLELFTHNIMDRKAA